MNRFSAVVLLLAGGLAAGSCGGSSSSPMGSTTPSGVTAGGTAAVSVTIIGNNGSMSFSPDPVKVRVGQSITWKNGDAIVHQVIQDSGGDMGGGGGGYYGGGGSAGTGFDMGQLAPGTTSPSITFTTAGTVRYHCAIHPTMTGTITISE